MRPKGENPIPESNDFLQRLDIRHQRQNIPQRENPQILDFIHQMCMQFQVKDFQTLSHESYSLMNSFEILPNIRGNVF
jgi:hypothetical protein